MHIEPSYIACYENSLDGILLTELNGQIFAANPAVCTMLGMTEKEICTSNTAQLIDTADPNFERFIYITHQNGKARGHLIFKPKNGTILIGDVITCVSQNNFCQQQITMIIREVTATFSNGHAAEVNKQDKLLSDQQQSELVTTDNSNGSEERYRVMVENSYDAILLLDENLTTIYRSPSTEHVMGFKDEERLGKSYLELTHPDDLGKVKGLQQIVINNPGISIPITLRAKHSNGHYLWFIGVATNLLHKKGVNAIVVNLREISERKKAEDALQQLSNKLLLATRAANMCIWDWDIVNDILNLDAAMYTLFGIDLSEKSIRFEAWYKRLHPEDSLRQHEEINAAIQGLKDFDTQFRIIMPDQSIRYIRALALVERDESGKALRMIGNNRDISELKLAILEKEKIMDELVRRNNELEEFTLALSHNLRAPVANISGLSNMLFDQDNDEATAATIKTGLCQSVKRVDEVIIEMNNVLQGRQQLPQK